jgi:hypothetical protein
MSAANRRVGAVSVAAFLALLLLGAARGSDDPARAAPAATPQVQPAQPVPQPGEPGPRGPGPGRGGFGPGRGGPPPGFGAPGQGIPAAPSTGGATT